TTVGDNLYTSSIVAIHAKTGDYAWHFQPTPADSWDYDATQPLVLAELTIDGRPRRVVMQANKNGFFYVIDRENGAFISGTAYAKVTLATRLDAKSRPIEARRARARGEVPPHRRARRGGGGHAEPRSAVAGGRAQLASDCVQPGNRARLSR